MCRLVWQMIASEQASKRFSRRQARPQSRRDARLKFLFSPRRLTTADLYRSRYCARNRHDGSLARRWPSSPVRWSVSSFLASKSAPRVHSCLETLKDAPADLLELFEDVAQFSATLTKLQEAAENGCLDPSSPNLHVSAGMPSCKRSMGWCNSFGGPVRAMQAVRSRKRNGSSIRSASRS